MSQTNTQTEQNKPMTDAQKHEWYDRQIKLQRKRTELSRLNSEYYQYEAARLQAIHMIANLTTQPKQAEPRTTETATGAETALPESKTNTETGAVFHLGD